MTFGDLEYNSWVSSFRRRPDEIVRKDFIRGIPAAHLSGHHATRDVQTLFLPCCEQLKLARPDARQGWLGLARSLDFEIGSTPRLAKRASTPSAVRAVSISSNLNIANQLQLHHSLYMRAWGSIDMAA
ncbi:MAG: hypothetical protein L0H63_08100 [Nitrococcus sp.]|nr:hypothetical protein [Nitrococcus sp.]